MNLWQIAWRNLKRRKLRTFLTILSIVIGVASALGVMTSVDSAKRAFPLYLKAAFGKADFTISGTDAYFGQNLLQEVQNVRGTTSVAILKENTKLRLEREGVSAIQKRVDLSGYSRLDTALTNFKAVEGKLANDGAVITDRTAKAWNAKVGDTIMFDTDRGVRSIEISAIVKYTVELMGPSNWTMAKYHPWSVAIPLSLMQKWFGLDGKIETIRVKADRGSDLAAVGEQLDRLVRQHGNIYVQPVVLDYDTQFKEVNTYFLLLYLAGFLGIALSAFIIYNSLFVSVQERRQEFAALRTIGYTPRQLRTFVLYEVCLLSIIGTLIGLVLGYGLAELLQKLIFMLFGVYEKGNLHLAKGLLVAVPAGTLIPLLASLYPIRQAGKVSVIASLKNDAPSANNGRARRRWTGIAGVLLLLSAFFIKSLYLIVPFMLGAILVFPYLFAGFIYLLKPLYRSCLGFSGTMASRNLSRNRGRTTMTSVILCLGIAMIVLMSSLNGALIQSFEKVIHATYGGDLDIHLHHIEKTDVEQLRQIPGVAGAETYPLHAAVWTLDGQKRQLPVYGVGEEWIDRFPLFTVKGQRPSELIGKLQEDEIVLDRIAFGAWGGQVGERLELDTPQGTQAFKVVSVVETMKNNGYGAFMRKSQFQDVFGIKYEKNALVLKDESVTPLQLRERIFDRFGARVEEMFGPEDWVTVIGASYTGSFTIVNFLIGLSILISGIGIANTLLISIMERIRELGMMRAVGVTRRQVIRMIRLEGVGMGLAATVIGCVLGIMLIYMTSTFLEIHSLTYQFGVSWIMLLLIGLFGLSVSLISSLAPAARAAKTPLSEALRYE
jgi:putative ABC transport system permease protein